MKNFGFYSAAYSDGYIYWLTRDKGIFCKKRLDSRYADLIMLDEDIPTDNSTVYGVCRGNLYGILNGGKFVFKYNLTDGTSVKYQINRENYALDLITYTDIIDNRIVVIGRYSPKLIVIDIDNMGIEEFDLVTDSNSDEGGRYYSRGYVRENNYIYIFHHINSQVIRIDLTDFKVYNFYLKSEIGYIEDGVATGDGFILLNEKGELYKVDKSFDNHKIFFSGLGNESKQEFSGIIRNKKEILLLPMFGKRYLDIDVSNGKIIDEFTFPNNTEYKNTDVVGCAPYLLDINGKYCLGMYGTNQLFFVDKGNFKNNYFQEVNIDNDAEIDYLIKRKIMFFKENDFELGDFVELVENLSSCRLIQNNFKNVGQVILDSFAGRG